MVVFVIAVSKLVHVDPGLQPPPRTPPDYNAFYQIGPDSLAKDGVPTGDVRGPFVLPSQAYPGTQHTYWIYVPAQYEKETAASLMVFQDGQAFKDMDGNSVIRAPNVLDNLIYRREIPVMIAVFINPGRTAAQPYTWGINTHGQRMGGPIMPEMMRWLWRDHPVSTDVNDTVARGFNDPRK